jgi:hypothetical protein
MVGGDEKMKIEDITVELLSKATNEELIDIVMTMRDIINNQERIIKNDCSIINLQKKMIDRQREMIDRQTVLVEGFKKALFE